MMQPTKRIKGECGVTMSSEDRISQLPTSLIHHIFSFIPTIHLVRMSVVSKRWRHVWLSSPFLYLDDFVRNRKRVSKFMTYCLRCRKVCMQLDPDTAILSFRCNTKYSFKNRRDIGRIDDWLNFVFKSKVKELDLCVLGYCLPEFVLNASSLTILKLSALKLVAPSLSTFPYLKVLSLRNVEYDSKSLQNLISGCPTIEELHLCGYKYKPTDFVVSGTLKNLSLLFLHLTDQWLHGLISQLPLLERLALKFYIVKNSIGIHSHSLKYVLFESYNTIETVPLTITTPNLVSLKISCYARSIISVEAPNLLKASLKLRDESMDETSYIALVQLFSNLNSVKKMVLKVCALEVLIFPETIRKKCTCPFLNVKHLNVKLYGRLNIKNAELSDSWNWCAPSVETLQIERKKKDKYWFN